MIENITTPSDESMTKLVRGIVNDAEELIRHQFTLLKVEVQQDLRKTREAATSLVMGLVICLVGSIVLSLMLVHLLAWAFPDVAVWIWYAVVGGGILTVGLILTGSAFQQFRSFNPLPDQTVKALEENLAWTTKPKASSNK